MLIQYDLITKRTIGTTWENSPQSFTMLWLFTRAWTHAQYRTPWSPRFALAAISAGKPWEIYVTHSVGLLWIAENRLFKCNSSGWNQISQATLKLLSIVYSSWYLLAKRSIGEKLKFRYLGSQSSRPDRVPTVMSCTILTIIVNLIKFLFRTSLSIHLLRVWMCPISARASRHRRSQETEESEGRMKIFGGET